MDIDSLLLEVKTIIIAERRSMSSSELCNLFFQETGQKLNASSYNYNSVEHMLSNHPEHFKICEGDGGGACFSAVVKDNMTRKITSMMDNEKNAKKKKIKAIAKSHSYAQQKKSFVSSLNQKPKPSFINKPKPQPRNNIIGSYSYDNRSKNEHKLFVYDKNQLEVPQTCPKMVNKNSGFTNFTHWKNSGTGFQNNSSISNHKSAMLGSYKHNNNVNDCVVNNSKWKTESTQFKSSNIPSMKQNGFNSSVVTLQSSGNSYTRQQKFQKGSYYVNGNKVDLINNGIQKFNSGQNYNKSKVPAFPTEAQSKHYYTSCWIKKNSSTTLDDGKKDKHVTDTFKINYIFEYPTNQVFSSNTGFKGVSALDDDICCNNDSLNNNIRFCNDLTPEKQVIANNTEFSNHRYKAFLKNKSEQSSEVLNGGFVSPLSYSPRLSFNTLTSKSTVELPKFSSTNTSKAENMDNEIYYNNINTNNSITIQQDDGSRNEELTQKKVLENLSVDFSRIGISGSAHKNVISGNLAVNQTTYSNNLLNKDPILSKNIIGKKIDSQNNLRGENKVDLYCNTRNICLAKENSTYGKSCNMQRSVEYNTCINSLDSNSTGEFYSFCSDQGSRIFVNYMKNEQVSGYGTNFETTDYEANYADYSQYEKILKNNGEKCCNDSSQNLTKLDYQNNIDNNYNERSLQNYDDEEECYIDSSQNLTNQEIQNTSEKFIKSEECDNTVNSTLKIFDNEFLHAIQTNETFKKEANLENEQLSRDTVRHFFDRSSNLKIGKIKEDQKNALVRNPKQTTEGTMIQVTGLEDTNFNKPEMTMSSLQYTECKNSDYDPSLRQRTREIIRSHKRIELFKFVAVYNDMFKVDPFNRMLKINFIQDMIIKRLADICSFRKEGKNYYLVLN